MGLFEDSLERKSLILFLYSIGYAILGYFFQILCARNLSIEDFGLLNCLIAAMGLLSFPSKVIQTITAKFLSENKTHTVWQLEKIYVQYGIKLVLMLLCFIPLLFYLLNIQSVFIEILLFVLVLCTIATGVPWGFLQGKLKAFDFGVQQFFLHSSKLGFAYIAILLGLGVQGLLLALILSTLFTLLWGVMSLGKREKNVHSTNKLDIPDTTKLLFLIYLLSNIDLILAKRFLSSENLGIYASISIFGKALYVLPDSIVSIFYPLLNANKQSNFSLMKQAIKLELIIFLPIIFFFFLFGENLFLILGIKYKEAAGYLPIYSVSMLILSIGKIPIHFLLAHEDYRSVWSLAGTILLQLIFMMLFSDNFSWLMGGIFLSSLMLLVLSFLFVLRLPQPYFAQRSHQYSK